MATFVHFNISADDPVRARKFYEELFDWTFRKLPPPGDYYLIETAHPDGSAGLGGGLAKREQPGQHTVNFIGVTSIDEALASIELLGGQVITPKQAVPGWGYNALCLDTEGNPFGLWEEDERAE